MNGIKKPKAMKINMENWPTFAEALKAKGEADIVGHQSIGLFLSRSVQQVFQAIRCKYDEERAQAMITTGIFNYGYILGVRAERARRKGRKEGEA